MWLFYSHLNVTIMLTKFGAIITDGRGKVGSFYIGKNHYGTYLAEIVPAANPQTTFQQLRRAQTAYLTQYWKGLTESQMREWDAETVNYPRTNSIGNTYFMTGQTLFISLNLNLWMIRYPQIDNPVTKVDPPPCGSFTLNANISGASYLTTFAAPPTDLNTVFICYATDGLSPGKNYISTKYRSIQVHDADGTNPIDWYGTYNSMFPSATIGQKTFCKIVSVDINCGNMSIPFFASDILS